MSNKLILLALIISLLISGCSSSLPEPTPTPNIEETVSALAMQMISETLTAAPTATLPPTDTPEPTPTLTSTAAVELTAIPTETATLTPEPFRGEFSLGDQSGESEGLLRIENQTGEPYIIISISGLTWKKQLPVYYSWEVTGFLLQMIKYGYYDVTVEIPGKTTLTAKFQQNNKDKTTITISRHSIKIVGP